VVAISHLCPGYWERAEARSALKAIWESKSTAGILCEKWGVLHCCVYATLLDTAGWFTAAAAHDESCWLATSEMSIHFLAPARQTPLRVVGRLLKQGTRQDVAEMHLYDGDNRLIGHATGTFILLTKVPLS
jgi:uncharacterized protein (TIGR00369 family)